MLASFAFALSSCATSVFKHMPVIPGLGIFLFTTLYRLLFCCFWFLNFSIEFFLMVSSSIEDKLCFFLLLYVVNLK
jgi:hypothetical protein